MKIVRTLALVVATSTAVLVPAQAFADSTIHKDATKDMISFNFDDEEEEEPAPTPAPERSDGDIRGVSVTHAARKVLITVRYVEWTRNPDLSAPMFRLRTNEHKERTVQVFPGTRTRASRAFMTTAYGDDVRCRMTTSVQIVANKVTLGIPRKCLSRPRWVRVGTGIVAFRDPLVFVDDAYLTGRINDQLTLGPRLSR
jgi:hypothetical protein